MEKYKIIGFYVGKFTDKETGEVIEYGKIFVEPNKLPSKGTIEGTFVETEKVKPELLEGLSVNDVVSFVYNKWRKVSDIICVD